MHDLPSQQFDSNLSKKKQIDNKFTQNWVINR